MAKFEYNCLRIEMAIANVSNKELADYLKVLPSTVSRWKTNDQQPDLATLNQIALFLHVDVRRLVKENSLPGVPMRSTLPPFPLEKRGPKKMAKKAVKKSPPKK
jgi:transcriptional regulator with XRE-family HTH domain